MNEFDENKNNEWIYENVGDPQIINGERQNLKEGKSLRLWR